MPPRAEDAEDAIEERGQVGRIAEPVAHRDRVEGVGGEGESAQVTSQEGHAVHAQALDSGADEHVPAPVQSDDRPSMSEATEQHRKRRGAGREVEDAGVLPREERALGEP